VRGVNKRDHTHYQEISEEIREGEKEPSLQGKKERFFAMPKDLEKPREEREKRSVYNTDLGKG